MIVVIAEKEELELVHDLGYDDLPIIITGVGAINVIKALKDLPKDTEILNIGYCGSNNLKIGTQVEPQRVATFHEKSHFIEYTLEQKSSNLDICCYTSTDFVTETKIKEDCIFDMELAYIRALFDNVNAIKVVSDNLNKYQYVQVAQKH